MSRKTKKAGGSKTVKHKWLLASEAEIEAVALAQLCQSNRRIMLATGFTDQSVNYVLTKAKKLEGYKKYHTYRSEWRDGTGKLVNQVVSQVLPQLKEQAGNRLPALITHPTPKVAPPQEEP